MAIILGKPILGRKETLEYANDKFNWRKDVIIGISSYYAFWAWIRARLTNKKCIYYCIDFYSPAVCEGFFDYLFIRLSWMLDKFLVKHCDELWNISVNINEGRRKHEKIDPKAKLVPLAYPPHYFRFKKPLNKSTVFVGVVPYGLGVWTSKTYWLGNGDSEINDMLFEISVSSIGIAVWDKKGNNYYGDPGKTKLYSACGIPVITTDNSPYASIIKQTKAGIVVKYSKKAVKDAEEKILKNYSFYKSNVKKTWEYINADKVLRHIKLLE